MGQAYAPPPVYQPPPYQPPPQPGPVYQAPPQPAPAYQPPAGTKYCMQCGQAMASGVTTCPRCGAANPA